MDTPNTTAHLPCNGHITDHDTSEINCCPFCVMWFSVIIWNVHTWGKTSITEWANCDVEPYNDGAVVSAISWTHRSLSTLWWAMHWVDGEKSACRDAPRCGHIAHTPTTCQAQNSVPMTWTIVKAGLRCSTCLAVISALFQRSRTTTAKEGLPAPVALQRFQLNIKRRGTCPPSQTIQS